MNTTEDVTLTLHINPLAFLEADNPASVTLEDVLKYLCVPATPSAIPDLVARYKRITVDAPQVFVAPTEARLLERLIWPLRHAKGSFMLGNFLGTISLCGMVSEMVAILVFDLADIRWNGKALDEPQQKRVLGSTFERQGQDRRVDILLGLDLIQDEHKQRFDSIRSIRRKYLHLWSADHVTLEQDAVTCFKAASYLVISSLGLAFKDGKVVLREELFRYLRAHGVATPRAE